jgi:alkylation response protein AidB-like acyl-CoA dehydrogenase
MWWVTDTHRHHKAPHLAYAADSVWGALCVGEELDVEDWTEVHLGGRATLDGRVRDALGRVVEAGAATKPSLWVEAARDVGAVLPRPGSGDTARLWGTLATLGAMDLQLARAVEPHVDALAILGEADDAGHSVPAVPGATWGVYAAEGPGVRLVATPEADGWRLDGTKPWCSLADRVSHALVTAWVDDERRGLFAVDLGQPGVTPGAPPEEWHARGLVDVVSLPVGMEHARAHAVGPPGWYLERDGFAWGGMGVAAVWYGGAVGLARRLLGPRSRPRDDVALLHLGTVARHLAAADAVLGQAAEAIDQLRAGGQAGALWALRVRAVVAAACEAVLTAVEHDLGPGPQVSDPTYAAALADLRLYLRQHHAERDLVALGRAVVDAGESW